MTRTDRFDDLAGSAADELQAEFAERVRGEAHRLRHERLILHAGAKILTPGDDPDIGTLCRLSRCDAPAQPARHAPAGAR